MASITSGVNVCNIYNKQAGYTTVFTNASGELFDNYLNEMLEDPDGSIWIGPYDRFIKCVVKKRSPASFITISPR